jgi:hypothetical protein
MLQKTLLFFALTTVLGSDPSKHPHPYSGLSKPARGTLPSLSRHFSRNSVPRVVPFCEPGQSCWPSFVQWASLNASVEGTLIAVEPPLAPCFGWAGMPPDQAVCDANIANFSNSYWRASQPGALQDSSMM